MPAIKRVLAIILCMILSLTAAFAAAEPSTDEIDENVAKIFKKWKTSGGIVVAAKDGVIIYEKTYGFADKIAKEKVSSDSYFRIASVSKLVTGCVAMRLVEEGKLDLDENIGSYLADPAYKVANPRYTKIPITARMLMTHTSSIKSDGGFSSNKPLSDILNVKKRKKANFYDKKPGTYYKYSNYGVGTLGCMIEFITGQKLTIAAKNLLFNDMGIDASYTPVYLKNPQLITTTYNKDGSIAVTRSRKLREEYDDTVDVEHDYYEGYGKLYITGKDLCRIGIMLCDEGVLDGVRYLQKETVKEMMSSQEGKGGVKIDSPYGLCIHREKTLIDGKILYGHQGLQDGILCNLYYDPETRFVFVMLTNGCKSDMNNHVGSLSRQMFAYVWETLNK